MRILITNDDGINAPGLIAMTEIATAIAGPDGEVWTVAPAFEQSGVGHCISYTHPFQVSQFGDRRFAAEGTPADCVLTGLYHILTDGMPDLVLSGVNRGNNSAENTLYSGTIGAAMEAALQGVPAIALSQYLGPKNIKEEDPFECARVHGADVVRKLIPTFSNDTSDYRLFYNVNFPPVPAADCKGPKAATQGFRTSGGFRVAPQPSPTGREFMWLQGTPQSEPTAPGSDAHANLEGYISVTPMRADLTANADMDAAAQALAAP